MAHTTFEIMLMTQQAYPQAADAAMRDHSVSAIQLVVDENKSTSQEQWLDKQLISQTNFCGHFKDDVRASDFILFLMQQTF